MAASFEAKFSSSKSTSNTSNKAEPPGKSTAKKKKELEPHKRPPTAEDYIYPTQEEKKKKDKNKKDKNKKDKNNKKKKDKETPQKQSTTDGFKGPIPKKKKTKTLQEKKNKKELQDTPIHTLDRPPIRVQHGHDDDAAFFEIHQIKSCSDDEKKPEATKVRKYTFTVLLLCLRSHLLYFT